MPRLRFTIKKIKQKATAMLKHLKGSIKSVWPIFLACGFVFIMTGILYILLTTGYNTKLLAVSKSEAQENMYLAVDSYLWTGQLIYREPVDANTIIKKGISYEQIIDIVDSEMQALGNPVEEHQIFIYSITSKVKDIYEVYINTNASSKAAPYIDAQQYLIVDKYTGKIYLSKAYPMPGFGTPIYQEIKTFLGDYYIYEADAQKIKAAAKQEVESQTQSVVRECKLEGFSTMGQGNALYVKCHLLLESGTYYVVIIKWPELESQIIVWEGEPYLYSAVHDMAYGV